MLTRCEGTLGLILLVCILTGELHGWSDNETTVTAISEGPFSTGWSENETSVSATNEGLFSTGWSENETSVTATNEGLFSTGRSENETSVTATNEGLYSTGWSENETSVSATNESLFSTGASATDPPGSVGMFPATGSQNTPEQPGFQNGLERVGLQRFTYDYTSLRRWGLVMAAIFFIMGLFVLVADRIPIPTCRRLRVRKARSYNVFQGSHGTIQGSAQVSDALLVDTGVTAL